MMQKSKKATIITLGSTKSGIIENDYLYQSLRALVENSRIGQSCNRDHSDIYAENSWLKSFCTVRVGSCRGSGHSSSIARIIYENNWKALVYTPTRQMSETIRNGFSQISREDNVNVVQGSGRTYSARGFEAIYSEKLKLHQYQRGHIDAVIMDNASSERLFDEESGAWDSACRLVDFKKDFFLMYLQ